MYHIINLSTLILFAPTFILISLSQASFVASLKQHIVLVHFLKCNILFIQSVSKHKQSPIQVQDLAAHCMCSDRTVLTVYMDHSGGDRCFVCMVHGRWTEVA